MRTMPTPPVLEGREVLISHFKTKPILLKSMNRTPSNICIFVPKGHIPSDIALTKIVAARMKIIKDALPIIAITFVTTCCPTRAAMVATAKK
jgi:hypothetical protein